MKQYNPDIHHRHSIRLKGYDYSQEGLYFITICTVSIRRTTGVAPFYTTISTVTMNLIVAVAIV